LPGLLTVSLLALSFSCHPSLAAEEVSGPIAIRDLDPIEAAKVSYTKQVRPLLDEKCVGCHSGKKPKGLFDVTSVENLLKEGGSAGPGVIPGNPDESAVIQYVRGLKDPRMPKDEPPLSVEEVHLLREWILAGAVDDTGQEEAVEEAQSHKPSLSLSTDPDLQAQLQELLFITDPVEQLIKKRNIRLRYLPEPPAPPEVKAPVYSAIDRFIAEKWESQEDEGLRGAVPDVCDDPTFLRRAYLDVIGRIPSIEEAQAFLDAPSPDKRNRLVDDLLSRNSDYAANWTPFWEDALCSNGNHQGGVGTHGNYREWAFNNFEENKPYDVMVAELIDPTMPNHPERYILTNEPKKMVQSAANTAQVFLGTGLKCASCHNHFENKEWTQTRFYGFAGYFSPSDLELIRCEVHSGQFIPTKFIFDMPDVPTDVPKDENGRLRRVAQLLVDPTDPRFAKTIVNRLWKRHLGLGLFESPDDFRLERAPSHPELLDWLADDFMRHGYDIKHTIRLIMASRTYQLCYKPEWEDHYDVSKPGEPRYFRSPALRRLTAEQFLDSLMLSAGLSDWNGNARTYQDDESTPLTRALGRPSARNEVSTARPDDVAVVQALELLNGEEYYDRIYKGPVVVKLAQESDLPRIVDSVCRRTLNRPASPEEIGPGVSFLEASLVGSQPAGQPAEVIWIDDEIPSCSIIMGTSGAESWKWVESNEGPVLNGSRSHRQAATGAQVQHYARGANPALEVGRDDVLFSFVYIDPANPPKTLMMQWFEEGWEHRAYWGEDAIAYGAGNEASHLSMGPLPESGKWVRLEVPAKSVGIEGGIEGWSFDQAGGTVYWDKSGVVHTPRNPKAEAIGDMFWAFVTSPRFQYIN
jgi:hypothetical protein